MQHAAPARGNQRKHAPIPVSTIGDLGSQVRGHALDVLHQGDRIFEDVVIDALQEIPRLHTVSLKDRVVGVVNMAAAIGRGAAKFTVDCECPGRRPHVVFAVQFHNFSGYFPFLTSAAMLSTTRGRSSR